MSIRGLFRSSTATTLLVLLIPFFLISISSYSGDASGAPPLDGSTEAGLDGGAGADTSLDAGFDASFDAGFDSGFDTGFDTGFDLQQDLTPGNDTSTGRDLAPASDTAVGVDQAAAADDASAADDLALSDGEPAQDVSIPEDMLANDQIAPPEDSSTSSGDRRSFMTPDEGCAVARAPKASEWSFLLLLLAFLFFRKRRG